MALKTFFLQKGIEISQTTSDIKNMSLLEITNADKRFKSDALIVGTSPMDTSSIIGAKGFQRLLDKSL
jgi:hypothetical protein